jgi:hypothetical protein
MVRARWSVVGVLLFWLAACGDEPGEVAGHTVSLRTANGMAPQVLAESRASLAWLAGGALSSVRAAESGLTSTDGGKVVAKYLARCALAEGVTLEVSGLGFAGLLGLAGTWATGPCDGDCQRWVSACLLGHTNALAQPVPFSARGPHARLVSTPEERAEYPAVEAAFYGNVFVEGAPAYACASPGIAPAALRERLCGAGVCGITVVGACELLSGLGACDTRSGAPDDFYTDCHSSLGSGAVMGEVLTTYLPSL